MTVASDGWLEQEDVERISGMRSIVVPAAMAYSTRRAAAPGRRAARAGERAALPRATRGWSAPSGCAAAGWEPKWTNADALAAHLEAVGHTPGAALRRLQRKDATRAAAGAAVAVVGTVAIARARANRRRRRG